MNRRRFLESAGLVAATTLSAQTPAPRPSSKSKITTSVVLDILGGTIDQELDIAAGGGCDSMMMLAQYAPWSDADVARVKKFSQSHKIPMHALLAQYDWKKRPVSIVDPKHREGFLSDIKTAIGFAQRFEMTQLVVTSGLRAKDVSDEQMYASLTEGVKRAADMVAAANFTLLVEPLNSLIDHPGCFLTSCVDGLKLVKEINHPNVKLLFDVYHEQVMRGNVINSLKAAMPLVPIIHIADNPGRNDPGTGELNFANVYKAISDTGFSGHIAMEYKPLGEPVASMSKSIKTLRAAFSGVAS